MRTLSIRAAAFLRLLAASSLVHAQSEFLTESVHTPTPTSCPAAVTVQNGGFDSGLAPWETLPAAPVKPTFSVVSPGYNGGAHALRLEFPAANVTSWDFLQDIGLQCKGQQYVTSFAVNWLNFSIHGDPNTNFCRFSVVSSYCYDNQEAYLGYYNATNTPGWQYHSYTCTAQKTGYASFVVGVGCLADYIIPAFTWQMTDFSIQLVVSSTPPQPTSSTSTSSQVTSMPSQSSTQSSTPQQSSTSSQSLNISQSSLSSLISSSPSASSITSNALPTGSTNISVVTTNATAIPTSSASVPMNNTTSVPTLILGNNACRAPKNSFLAGPMGLIILLLPYVLY
ncbi:hypothetical protein F5884DRAFT_751180 [Xylogone sp. PMI_703]|nr:hypothetical protein F5884DRAFT_751180 [Xylogone sp. PMI_703]